MTKRSTGMVSPKTSAALHRRMHDHRVLKSDYARYLRSEPHCAEDVANFVSTYTRVMLQRVPMELNDDGEPGVDIDDALQISDHYHDIEDMFVMAFAAGLNYGQARFYDEFEEQFGNESSSALDDMI